MEQEEPSIWPGDRAVYSGKWTIGGLPSMRTVVAVDYALTTRSQWEAERWLEDERARARQPLD